MHQKEFTSLPPRPKPYASVEDALPWYSWCEPNTKWPSDDSVITHEYIEEVVFLEGGLRDLTLQQEWGPGAYAYRLPGMKHGPYEASEKGCLEFVRCVGVRMEAKDDVNS
ncbi:hypothetical protein DFH05DRAFT_1400956 [Lentinula detonsa]|uniref:ChrR-like cupin domain-containing protein n=1 Tax=Lentinula detonsa TaxID=2804962 RepID=A0A9W8NXD8_9AGAR|nr:hypothetical protein DFH05DRAFT_1400956 [Lentinula detonsa]